MYFERKLFMNFKQIQYERVINILQKEKDIFNNDKGNGYFKGKPRAFVLKNAQNNLYSVIATDSIAYFENNNICWWNGELTNHTLSSQIACLNHLFPIRNDKEAVLAIVKSIEPNIIDVLEILTDKTMPAFIQFEAVSNIDHLNEVTSTRGSNCTSIDALIYGLHKDGRKILFPIEWKYVESYGNEDKACGEKGGTRKRRYTELINKSSQLKSDNVANYYFEPFYQLMRQTLWAEQMIANKEVETIKADDYMHINVIPSKNSQLLEKSYQCSGKNLENTWLSCINNQDKYVIVSPEELLKHIDSYKYTELIEYLGKRYWW